MTCSSLSCFPTSLRWVLRKLSITAVSQTLSPEHETSRFCSVTLPRAVPQTHSLPFRKETGDQVAWAGSHRHHVVTLHVGLVVVLTLVVELAEEVESHHGVEVNHHGQETHGQNQLWGREKERKWVFSTLRCSWARPRKQEGEAERGTRGIVERNRREE